MIKLTFYILVTPNDIRNYLNRVLQLAHEIHCKQNMVSKWVKKIYEKNIS